MPRRRHRRGLYERLASHNDSMSPGTIGGRVSSAAPVLSASDVLAEQAGDIGVVAMSEGESWQDDQFTASGDGPQDVTLTYLPISDHHMSVFVRELRRRRDIDWTRDGQVVSLLAAPDVRDSDPVDVWYAYRSGAPVAPAEALPLNIPFASDGWKYHTVTNAADIPTWVAPSFDDTSWSSGTAPIGMSGFTDIDGHTVATVVPGDNTGELGHVMDLIVRRRFPAGEGINVGLDESNYINGIWVDGVFVVGSDSSTGLARKYDVPIPDQSAPWLLAISLTVANGATTGGIDIEVTGTET